MKNVITGVRFSCDRWDVGVNISACACAFMYACTVGVQPFLPAFSPCLSVCSVIPPSLFNYALNLCVVAQITQGRRESVVLCGCLRGTERERMHGAREKER